MYKELSRCFRMPHQIRNKNNKKNCNKEPNRNSRVENVLEGFNRRTELTEERIRKLGDMLTTLSEEDYAI